MSQCDLPSTCDTELMISRAKSRESPNGVFGFVTSFVASCFVFSWMTCPIFALSQKRQKINIIEPADREDFYY